MNIQRSSVIPVVSKDGKAIYFPDFIPKNKSNMLFSEINTLTPWQNDIVNMFGKKIFLSRKVAWYADEGITYTYSGETKRGIPFNKTLLELKKNVEEFCREKFNSCLLNLYHNGAEGMGWHSDNEPELEKNGTIASLSLGAERNFHFKHKKTGQKVSILLENGSLLLMQGEIQQHWLHALPKSKKVKDARINLTFRNIIS